MSETNLVSQREEKGSQTNIINPETPKTPRSWHSKDGDSKKEKETVQKTDGKSKMADETPQEKLFDDSDPRSMFTLSLSKIKNHPDMVGYRFKPAPFNIKWVHGYNHKAGVINLNTAGSTQILYSASNCGVVYNWTTHTMKILQGHRHMVTNISSDALGQWLVTGDSGQEDCIIVWDKRDYFPQRTIFNPHQSNKLAKLALSADAKYLLTVGYSSDNAQIYWWIWSYGHERPNAQLELPMRKDAITAMTFNPYDSTQFLLLTKSDIWLGMSEKIFVFERGVLKETEDYRVRIRCPNKMVSDVGRLVCCAFVNTTKQIVVGASRGGILVYGYTMEYNKDLTNTNFENLKYIKTLRVEKCRINCIVNIDGVVVTGNSCGEIHFYDDQIKLLYWIHGFKVDNVKRISFNLSERSCQILDPKCGKVCHPCWEQVVAYKDKVTGEIAQKLVKKKLPTDATTAARPFLVRDFVIQTLNQGVAFVDFVTERIKTIFDYQTSPALSLAVHPEKSNLCIGYQDGKVEMLNLDEMKIFERINLREHYKVVIPPKDLSIHGDYEVTLPELSVTCLKYAPSGLHLACGLSNGQLLFLDPTTLANRSKKPHKDTQFAIKYIDFSEDSLTMAMADIGKTVCVYKYDCEETRWHFVGKHRAHYKDITNLTFLPRKNPSGDYKLISLGADRVMVEYDIGLSQDEYLEILSIDRMEQSAIPLTAIHWPTPAYVDPATCKTDLPLILVANDEHKYKIINYDTTMTLSTVLGPRYEHPVNKVKLISREVNGEMIEYLLFATKNTMGLQLLPLDGNPWKHVAQLGHPIQITVMCFRQDLNRVYTIGSRDNCTCFWSLNHDSVEKTALKGGGDLDPYYCLIENGRPGWLFQEIRDLFYYIQILCQGTFSPAQRGVKDYIPIDSLPDLMRALGFFPSEYEVENLIVEAKFKVYQREPSMEIDFEEFVKLYLNHRPAFGENIRKIRNAFKTFATFRRDEYTWDKTAFVNALSSYGECFPTNLSWYLLSILAGHSFEERAQMSEDDFNFLPQKLKFGDILSTILGVGDGDAQSDQVSLAESIASMKSGSSQESGEELTEFDKMFL